MTFEKNDIVANKWLAIKANPNERSKQTAYRRSMQTVTCSFQRRTCVRVGGGAVATRSYTKRQWNNSTHVALCFGHFLDSFLL